jgi:coronin-1B/1C/6
VFSQFLITGSDGNIRYFELENDKFEFLSEHKSADPQRGVAFMPKRGVNMHENEVARAYKTVNDQYIEPVSFIVPRRSENFQDDIYPPTTGVTPAMSSSEWLGGKEAIPPKISMASLFDGEGIKEVSGVEEKPTGSMDAPALKPAEAPKAAETPKAPEPASPKAAPEPVSEPTSAARPAPSMKEQGASMAAMVNKFADGEEEANVSDDDDSSFEEVPKPVERPSRPAAAGYASPRVSSPLRPKEVETKQAETKQAETKQAETKQAETKQAETKPEPTLVVSSHSPFRFLSLCHLLTILVLYCPINR